MRRRHPRADGSPFSLNVNEPSRPSSILSANIFVITSPRDPSELLDRVEHDLRRLRGIDRRTGRSSCRSGSPWKYASANSLASPLNCVDRLAGNGQVHALGRRRAGVVDRLLRREAVRREQLDVTVVGPSTATLSLITWAPFSSIRPPRKTASASGCLDLLEQRLVATMPSGPTRRSPPTLMPERLRGVPEVRRDAEAVGLLVVQDVDVLHAELLGELRDGGALVGVVERQRARSSACRTGSTCPARSCRSQARPASGRRTCWPARSSRCRRPVPG